MARTSCVLFDLGGVIVNWHNSWFIKEVSEEFQLEKKRVSVEFDKNLADISTGRINEQEFWHVIGKELESSKLMNLHESLLDKIFRKHVSVNELMIDLSRNLSQKGMPVGILSNTEHVTYSAVSELLSLEHFEHKFLSYKIGHLKPEPKIYKHVIDNIPFPKEEIFFIDDLKSNVESARSEGIDAVQYSDFDDLVKECRLRDVL
jgi:putative hydrolase of the HAD superfamily